MCRDLAEAAMTRSAGPYRMAKDPGQEWARRPARASGRCLLLSVTAQPLDIENRHPTIFQPQQALLLQLVQRPVRVLPRHAGECADFLLRDLQMRLGVRIEDRVEQRGDA